MGKTTKKDKKEMKFIAKQSKEIEKNDTRSMSDLLTELKKYPYGSDKHTKVRKSISKKIVEKYPDQFVLCTYNKFDTEDQKAYLSRLPEVSDFDTVDAFSPRKTFFEDNKFEFVPREEAEYNFHWKQISVFGFITDGANYIILRKKEDDAFTMIGGHVDYSMEVYQSSQLEIIKNAMQQEVNEEISHRKQLIVPDKPIAVVNTFNKFHDLFHMALIYKIEVDDADNLFTTLRTGEPEKHDIVKISGKESLMKLPKLHHWFKQIEKYL